MELTLNDWKYKIRKKTSQNSLFKILCFNNKSAMKIKDLKNLSNKDTCFTFQYNNINLFKFIS